MTGRHGFEVVILENDISLGCEVVILKLQLSIGWVSILCVFVESVVLMCFGVNCNCRLFGVDFAFV